MSYNPLDAVAIDYAPGGRYAASERVFQGIPGIEVSHSGRIWATWYGGGEGEGPENYVILVTSADNGVTWSGPVAVIDPPGNVRAYDPTLWVDPLGRLWWFWSQSQSIGSIHDGRAGVWGAFTTTPDAPHPTFSTPRRLADGVMMNKPTVLSNGKWALPTAVWEFAEPKLDELKSARFSNITVSPDQGASFVLRGGADVPDRCFDEHMIVELKDGRLWMLVRTLYGIGQSFSSDEGRTWTPGEDSGLGGPNSRFFIRRLSSGNLLLINHADIPPAEAVKLRQEGKTWRTRTRLTALLSVDDGKSWKGGLTLDERDSVTYPDGAEDKHGVIRIIYDRRRYVRKGGEADILMASFREADVLAGRPVSADARFKVVVNRITGVPQGRRGSEAV